MTNEPAGSYSFTSQDKYFKDDYWEASKNAFAVSTELLSQITERSDLTGRKSIIAIPTGPDGGFGGLNSGYYVDGSPDTVEQISVEAKDIFSTCKVHLKAISASKNKKGAYWPIMTRSVQNTVKMHGVYSDLLMFVGKNARIGLTKSTTAYISGGDTDPVIEFDAATFNHRRFYKNQLLNIGNSTDTGVEDAEYKVVTVSRATKQVTFKRTQGSFSISTSTSANDRYFYVANMFKAGPHGLEDVVEATAGSLYGLTYDAMYWGSLRIDAGNRPFSVELLNYCYAEQCSRVDKENAPSIIVVNYDLWAQISTDREHFKTIDLKPRGNGKPAVETGFSAISYVTSEGKEVQIVGMKHMAPKKMYLLNTQMISRHTMPDYGWVEDEGVVFLRTGRQPYIEAQYGGFTENFIHPTFQCVVDNIDHKQIVDF